MKSAFLKLSLMLSALAFVGNAQADILLEPYLGYHTGTSKQSGSADTKENGVVLGARAGFQSLGFMVGLDYMNGMMKDDDTPKNDLTVSDLGLFVGYNFPVMIRAYATYVPTAKVKVKTPSVSYDLEGNSMKLGVGFTALPMVSINLEYVKTKYTKGLNGVTLLGDVDDSRYGLTVSLPLTF